MKKAVEMYYKLRMLVGYLGEKSQHGWWPSTFLAATSGAFLQPVYPRSAALAAYHGVVEAGRVLHDQHIGIGRVYHLFRLPEEMEHDIHHAALESESESVFSAWRAASLASREAATQELTSMANGGLSAPEGPVRLGTRKSIDRTETIEDVARHYADAFRQGSRCFPYFKDTEPAARPQGPTA